MSSTGPAASSLRMRVPDGDQSSGAETAGSGPIVLLLNFALYLRPSELHRLGARCCATHQEEQGKFPALCSTATPHRSGDTIKNNHEAPLEQTGIGSNGGTTPLYRLRHGGIVRRPSQNARNYSHTSPRPMAKCQKPQKFRERWQTPTTFRKPARQSATRKQ